MRYPAPGFSCKSDLHGQVNQERGRKIPKVYGFGLKITILYFLALSASTQKFISAFGKSANNFVMSAWALKTFLSFVYFFALLASTLKQF
jgi:hypothetical protein